MTLLRTVLDALRLPALALALLAGAAVSPPPAAAQPAPVGDARAISGTVRGPDGPEAGVWVIAETRELPVRFIRIVVTDDQGRYLLPDLPPARYEVWVRGYGLVDSPKLVAEPGRRVDHVARAAPDARAAAAVYPAIHWYAMLRIPAADRFGGGSDIPAGITRERWLHQMKSAGCIGCHQLGQLSTRTIPSAFADLPHDQAWMQRVQSGQSGEQMLAQLGVLLGGAPFAYLGEWTARIAAGAVPPTRPSRPEGVERNIVVTLRDWMNEKHYLHDLIASDRRDPTVNAWGPLYGSPEYSSDDIPILDPVRNVATSLRLPVAPDTPEALGPGHAASAEPLGPSPYWGDEKIWNSRANNHNSMFDRQGRVWMAATGHKPANPAFCRRGSAHPSAALFPLERTNRRITMLDPKSGRYTAFETCFQTHHLQFGYDADDTLWTSGGGPVVGWINTRLLDRTGDIAAAQGWTAMILDTNGNGRRDDHVEPDQPLDPARDKRIQAGLYAVMPSPVDGSVWGTNFSFPGAIVRIAPGANPPATALAEIFNVPLPGFGPRGGDIDGQGVVWVSLSSGHLGSFDRRKCKGPLNGPRATGDHCPEGWSFHRYPGPGFEGIGENSAESSYYTWVDQHDTFGLGRDVPMSTGNLNDGLIAFKDGRMIVLRVPYPLGFYAKGFDGRIDDPNAGWKGRGLWTTNGDRTPWLIEGGKGTKPLTAHFQLRPHPLAP